MIQTIAFVGLLINNGRMVIQGLIGRGGRGQRQAEKGRGVVDRAMTLVFGSKKNNKNTETELYWYFTFKIDMTYVLSN